MYSLLKWSLFRGHVSFQGCRSSWHVLWKLLLGSHFVACKCVAKKGTLQTQSKPPMMHQWLEMKDGKLRNHWVFFDHQSCRKPAEARIWIHVSSSLLTPSWFSFATSTCCCSYHLDWSYLHLLLQSLMPYCWWTKSCTSKDDDYAIIYRALTIPGGAGFLPPTVSKLSCGFWLTFNVWHWAAFGCYFALFNQFYDGIHHHQAKHHFWENTKFSFFPSILYILCKWQIQESDFFPVDFGETPPLSSQQQWPLFGSLYLLPTQPTRPTFTLPPKLKNWSSQKEWKANVFQPSICKRWEKMLVFTESVNFWGITGMSMVLRNWVVTPI